jgi:hypothetical protein
MYRCTNARNFSEIQPTATAPRKLSKINHSTERTGTCEAPDTHDFKLEIIDLSLSQNESEIVPGTHAG